jgi:hypothetical protein
MGPRLNQELPTEQSSRHSRRSRRCCRRRRSQSSLFVALGEYQFALTGAALLRQPNLGLQRLFHFAGQDNASTNGRLSAQTVVVIVGLSVLQLQVATERRIAPDQQKVHRFHFALVATWRQAGTVLSGALQNGRVLLVVHAPGQFVQAARTHALSLQKVQDRQQGASAAVPRQLDFRVQGAQLWRRRQRQAPCRGIVSAAATSMTQGQ